MKFKTAPIQTPETPAIFGLRYLEEEEAELNDVVGCLVPASDPASEDDGSTYYMTGCDYLDID